jgi:hypothetical protein
MNASIPPPGSVSRARSPGDLVTSLSTRVVPKKCRAKECRAHERWVLIDSEPVAASGMFLRCTGLPSRSALAAPPLRLAALRWRGTCVILGRFRPPPVGSAACIVTGARFSVTRFPGVPPLRMCPCRIETEAAHSQGLHARRCAPSRAEQSVTLVPTGAPHPLSAAAGSRAVQNRLGPGTENTTQRREDAKAQREPHATGTWTERWLREDPQPRATIPGGRMRAFFRRAPCPVRDRRAISRHRSPPGWIRP